MKNTLQSAGMTARQIEVSGYRMLDMDILNGKPNDPGPSASRPWLIAGGWLLFAIGLVGAFLPVLPTTIFWIGAVWCWSRSAPQLTQRILSHPRFGQPVALFLEHGQMTRQGKWLASAGIAIGFALLHLLSEPGWPVSLLVGLTLAVVGLWLWLRPEPTGLKPEESQLSFARNTDRSAEAEGQGEG
jgi:uncharacterized membrane protein YbaN (DUF454 family)